MRNSSPATIDRLHRFLQQGAAVQFDWVTCNCGFWVCEWIAQVRGIDPVGFIRDYFEKPEQLQRYVAKAGGNEMFSRAIADRAGMEQTCTPRRGDVGLISTAEGASMAICVDPGQNKWAAKSPRGVVIAPFPVIIAWAV